MPIPLGILAVAGAGAGAAGDFVRLQTTLISSDTASITFDNLNNFSMYKHLQVRYVCRSSSGNNLNATIMRFNGDSGSNYNFHLLYGYQGVVYSEGYANQPYCFLGNGAGSGGVANNFNAGVCDILDFANTNKFKTIRTLQGVNTGSNINTVDFTSGAWRNTNAITSITLKPDGVHNFVNGTRISLYGIR